VEQSSSEVALVSEPSDRGSRLDQFLQARLPEYSRARLQDWIRQGRVLVDGVPQTPSYALRGGEALVVRPAAPPPLRAEPEDAPIRILYEDAAVIAVDKPAGLVVHAGAGNLSGTLVNRLVHHFSSLSSLGGDERPGIVHRLDRGTSGVLLVARNDAAHQSLARQFSSRTVEKIYLALVHGRVKTDRGRIEAPIARDPVRRTRMTSRLQSGRFALTEYEVLGRYGKFTWLRVRIGTGRTHQIRVHLASIGHPVAGDSLYGAPKDPSHDRYFLHAHRISFETPAGGARVTVESPLPPELAGWLASIMEESSPAQ
jgi:23S rRNA pseudouridine1911/1915/1917 synthase